MFNIKMYPLSKDPYLLMENNWSIKRNEASCNEVPSSLMHFGGGDRSEYVVHEGGRVG